MACEGQTGDSDTSFPLFRPRAKTPAIETSVARAVYGDGGASKPSRNKQLCSDRLVPRLPTQAW